MNGKKHDEFLAIATGDKSKSSPHSLSRYIMSALPCRQGADMSRRPDSSPLPQLRQSAMAVAAPFLTCRGQDDHLICSRDQ